MVPRLIAARRPIVMNGLPPAAPGAVPLMGLSVVPPTVNVPVTFGRRLFMKPPRSVEM